MLPNFIARYTSLIPRDGISAAVTPATANSLAKDFLNFTLRSMLHAPRDEVREFCCRDSCCHDSCRTDASRPRAPQSYPQGQVARPQGWNLCCYDSRPGTANSLVQDLANVAPNDLLHTPRDEFSEFLCHDSNHHDSCRMPPRLDHETEIILQRLQGINANLGMKPD